MKANFIETIKSNRPESVNESKKGFLEIYLPKSLKNIKRDIVSALILPEVTEKLIETIPFNEIELKNKVEILKIAKTFVADIEKGNKIFAFKGISTQDLVDDSLSSVGLTASYLRNNSAVLFFLEDFSRSYISKHRKKMTPGSLGRFKTYEWGNVCIVDLSEDEQSMISVQKLDLEILTNEFDAIFWNVGDDSKMNKSNLILTLLGISKSWTMVLDQTKAKYREIKKVQKNFENFGITLKGLMKSEESV